MSAKNRGSVVNKFEHYATPSYLTEAIMPYLQQYFHEKGIDKPRILEPAVGNGAIVNVFVKAFRDSPYETFDIDPQWTTKPQDFLTIPPEPAYDLIITNPPFSLAQKFIEQSKLWCRDEKSLIVMMLRVNFLGSKKRKKWFQSGNIPAIYVSPQRPKMKKNKKGKLGTDATEYAWMTFNPHLPPLITILDT